MGIMECFLIILILIVAIRAVNERFIHIQGDIALVLFSTVISAGLLIAAHFAGECAFTDVVNSIGSFGFSEYLLDVVLCFMLFAGAGKVNFRKFKSNIKMISLYNASGVCGSGSSRSVLLKAGADMADVIIALTPVDEITPCLRGQAVYAR